MLGTMATTAAGVVAGSFLFQGIQGLMNRNDTQNDATKAEPTHSAQAEPEHVAQQDTLPEELGDTYADSGGDSGDFA